MSTNMRQAKTRHSNKSTRTYGMGWNLTRLLVGASGRQVAGPRSRPAVDEYVARAADGYAAAPRPAAGYGCWFAVDVDVLGALGDGVAVISLIAAARSRLPADERFGASARDHTRCGALRCILSPRWKRSRHHYGRTQRRNHDHAHDDPRILALLRSL